MAENFLQKPVKTHGCVVHVLVKVKDGNVQEPQQNVFQVPNGKDFFIVAKWTPSNAVDRFIIKPPKTITQCELQKQQEFCYKIVLAENKHAGRYYWQAACDGHIQDDGIFDIQIVAAIQIPAVPRQLDHPFAVGCRPRAEVQPTQRGTAYNVRQRPFAPDPDGRSPDAENEETSLKQIVAMPVPFMTSYHNQGTVGPRPQVEEQRSQRGTPYSLRQRPNIPVINIPAVPRQLDHPGAVGIRPQAEVQPTQRGTAYNLRQRPYTPAIPIIAVQRQHEHHGADGCRPQAEVQPTQHGTSYNLRHRPYTPAPGGCTLPLHQWFNQPESMQQIMDLVMYADPTAHGVNRCWYGLGLLAAQIPVHELNSISYHLRGTVGNGPMKRVLEKMSTNGQFMVDVVHYFHQNQNRRVDIIRYIESFHHDCPACIPYYNL